MKAELSQAGQSHGHLLHREARPGLSTPPAAPCAKPCLSKQPQQLHRCIRRVGKLHEGHVHHHPIRDFSNIHFFPPQCGTQKCYDGHLFFPEGQSLQLVSKQDQPNTDIHAKKSAAIPLEVHFFPLLSPQISYPPT